jgi:periplasmic divalent cation tolerance protein
MPAIVVFCTVSSLQEARKLTKALVGEKLAACVSTVPRVFSTYWWKGKIETGLECLLIIKSRSEKYRALEKRIRGLHSYTVPEILALRVMKGNKDYLNWIRDSLR